MVRSLSAAAALLFGAVWLFPAGGHAQGAKGWGTIKGRVFYLSNKPCWNGTWRSELFIHSEETAAQGQYCPTAYDDPFCWEGDYDYHSSFGTTAIGGWTDGRVIISGNSQQDVFVNFVPLSTPTATPTASPTPIFKHIFTNLGTCI